MTESSNVPARHPSGSVLPWQQLFHWGEVSSATGQLLAPPFPAAPPSPRSPAPALCPGHLPLCPEKCPKQPPPSLLWYSCFPFLSPLSTMGPNAIVPPRVTLQALGPFSWSLGYRGSLLGQITGGSFLLPQLLCPAFARSLLQGAASFREQPPPGEHLFVHLSNEDHPTLSLILTSSTLLFGHVPTVPSIGHSVQRRVCSEEGVLSCWRDRPACCPSPVEI